MKAEPSYRHLPMGPAEDKKIARLNKDVLGDGNKPAHPILPPGQLVTHDGQNGHAKRETF